MHRIAYLLLVTGVVAASVASGPRPKPDDPGFAAAERTPVRIRSRDDLAAALKSPNPYYRAKAMYGIPRYRPSAPYLHLIFGQADDLNVFARGTALTLLLIFPESRNDPRIVPILQRRLADPEQTARFVATVELTRRGHTPPIPRLREMLAWGGAVPNLPCGLYPGAGIKTHKAALYEALAPVATPPIFALLMEHAPYTRDHDYAKAIYPQLGASLLRHPEAASLLLAAHGKGHGQASPEEFASHVFGAAGPKMLPVLHRALDRQGHTERLNAARACGEIANPSSVPHLLRALDREDALLCASIVRALGQCRSKKALPRLVRLYVQVRVWEQRTRLPWLVTCASLDALPGLWDDYTDLSRGSRRRPPSLPYDEERVTRRTVLDAVRRIGPGQPRQLYRALARAGEPIARREAAICLADGSPEDVARDLAALRELRSDPDLRTRMSAVVSLLTLGQHTDRPAILRWLASGDEKTAFLILIELTRVMAPAQIAFARAAIQTAGATGANRYARLLAQKLLGAGPG